MITVKTVSIWIFTMDKLKNIKISYSIKYIWTKQQKFLLAEDQLLPEIDLLMNYLLIINSSIY